MVDERTRKEIKQNASDKAESEHPDSAFLFWGKNAVIDRMVSGFLIDTVGKLARRGKIKGGGKDVFEKSISVADARRNGADRQDVVEGE